MQVAKGHTIPRQGLAVFINDFQIHAPHTTALLELCFHQLFSRYMGMFGQEFADDANRAGFGHAPALHHLSAKLLLKTLQHAAGHRRAANTHALDAQAFRVKLGVRIQVLKQHQPHRGHTL